MIPYVRISIKDADGSLANVNTITGTDYFRLYSDGSEGILYGGAQVTISNSTASINVADRTKAVIADGVTIGVFPAVNGTVPEFSPTTGQLQSGYDYTVIVDSGSISGKILTTDNMLEALQAYDTNLMSVIDAKIDAALGSIINGSY